MEEMQSTWKYYQSASIEQQQKDWAGSIKMLRAIKTIPELLTTFDKIEAVGLDNFLDMNIFKQNIAPMWEDPNNIGGGRILAEIPHSLKDKLHELWKKSVVFCVIELFKEINGCVFAEKANYRISLWISNPTNYQEIINAWKEVLDCDEITFSFSLHSKHPDTSKSKKRSGRWDKK